MSVGSGVVAVVNVAAVEQAVVLTMGDDHLAQPFGLQHRLPHPLFALHTSSVVGEGDAVGSHIRQIRQALPFLLHGDGAVGVNVDAIGRNEVQLLPQMVKRIGYGVQVRHGAHIGVTAPSRRRRAADHGLFIRKSRLTKMHMHIAKAGKNNIFRFANERKGFHQRSVRRNNTAITEANHLILHMTSHYFVPLPCYFIHKSIPQERFFVKPDFTIFRKNFTQIILVQTGSVCPNLRRDIPVSKSPPFFVHCCGAHLKGER